MTTHVPGSQQLHKTISDECRNNRRWDIISMGLGAEVENLLLKLLKDSPRNVGFKFHVVVTVERPET